MRAEDEIKSGFAGPGGGEFVTRGLYPKALRDASGSVGGKIHPHFLARLEAQGVPFGLADNYLPYYWCKKILGAK